MSSEEIAIRVENLSKCYHIYDKPHDRLLQMLLRSRKAFYREFWALKKVSFEIKKGETIGIVGRNGSGKSTLLQLICGTLNPTTGSVETNGRIAALLELGSGFNPEFTGRENVYLNGAVLGLNTQEIDQRFDDIAAFADIGAFIDQPVKSYSSGMTVRLAFAVSINVNPHILIVDEALAVGDELFQRKCFSKIESIRANGTTILFVSHSGNTIVELCDRALLLDSGEKLATGTPKYIVSCYQKLLYAPPEKQDEVRTAIRQTEGPSLIDAKLTEYNDRQPVLRNQHVDINHKQSIESFDPNLLPTSTIEYESHGARISQPLLLTLEGKRANTLIRNNLYRYCYTVHFEKSASNVRFGMLIKTISGVELGGGVSAASLKDSLPYVEAGQTYQIEFEFHCTLNAGVYFLNAGVVGTDISGNEIYLHRSIDIALFKVMTETNSLVTGIVDFKCVPRIQSPMPATGSSAND